MKNNIHMGTGPLTMLTIMFVGLKLSGHIDWPWVWVFSPIWMVWGAVLLCTALIFTVKWMLE